MAQTPVLRVHAADLLDRETLIARYVSVHH